VRAPGGGLGDGVREDRRRVLQRDGEAREEAGRRRLVGAQLALELAALPEDEDRDVLALADVLEDLREVTRKIRPDWDLSAPGLHEKWEAGDKTQFYPYRAK